jgi:hypothetical protein
MNSVIVPNEIYGMVFCVVRPFTVTAILKVTLPVVTLSLSAS